MDDTVGDGLSITDDPATVDISNNNNKYDWKESLGSTKSTVPKFSSPVTPSSHRAFGGFPADEYEEILQCLKDGKQPDFLSTCTTHRKHAFNKANFAVKNGLLTRNGKYLLVKGESEQILRSVHEKLGHCSRARFIAFLDELVTYAGSPKIPNGYLRHDYEKIHNTCTKCPGGRGTPGRVVGVGLLPKLRGTVFPTPDGPYRFRIDIEEIPVEKNTNESKSDSVVKKRTRKSVKSPFSVTDKLGTVSVPSVPLRDVIVKKDEIDEDENIQVAERFGGLSLGEYEDIIQYLKGNTVAPWMSDDGHSWKFWSFNSSFSLNSDGLLMWNGKYVLKEDDSEKIFREIHLQTAHGKAEIMNSLSKSLVCIGSPPDTISNDIGRILNACVDCQSIGAGYFTIDTEGSSLSLHETLVDEVLILDVCVDGIDRRRVRMLNRLVKKQVESSSEPTQQFSNVQRGRRQKRKNDDGEQNNGVSDLDATLPSGRYIPVVVKEGTEKHVKEVESQPKKTKMSSAEDATNNISDSVTVAKEDFNVNEQIVKEDESEKRCTQNEQIAETSTFSIPETSHMESDMTQEEIPLTAVIKEKREIVADTETTEMGGAGCDNNQSMIDNTHDNIGDTGAPIATSTIHLSAPSSSTTTIFTTATTNETGAPIATSTIPLSAPSSSTTTSTATPMKVKQEVVEKQVKQECARVTVSGTLDGVGAAPRGDVAQDNLQQSTNMERTPETPNTPATTVVSAKKRGGALEVLPSSPLTLPNEEKVNGLLGVDVSPCRTQASISDSDTLSTPSYVYTRHGNIKCPPGYVPCPQSNSIKVRNTADERELVIWAFMQRGETAKFGKKPPKGASDELMTIVSTEYGDIYVPDGYQCTGVTDEESRDDQKGLLTVEITVLMEKISNN